MKPWPVWPSWLEQHPVELRVSVLIPGQGTRLGFGFSPWWAREPEAADGCFSLTSVFLSLPSLSLRSLSMSLSEGIKKKDKKLTMYSLAHSASDFKKNK